MSFNFNITNFCNRQCAFCFEGRWREKVGPQIMTLENIEAVLSREPEFIAKLPRIGLLGGEPSSHPQFEEIIELLFKYVRMVYVMTNGIMSEDKARLLTRCMHLLNLDGPRDGKQGEMFARTVDIWDAPDQPPYGGSVTIDAPDKDFTFLKDLLARTRNIRFLRIGITAPGYEFTNPLMLETEERFDFGRAYLNLVKEIHAMRPDIRFHNECCLNDYVISDEDYAELQRYRIEGMRKICMQPNFDIFPDMSATWCFPFVGVEEMTVPDVLALPNLQAVFTELMRKFKAMCDRLGFDPRVETAGCVAHQYYQKVIKPARQDG
jgi:organic radical activating enzyme